LIYNRTMVFDYRKNILNQEEQVENPYEKKNEELKMVYEGPMKQLTPIEREKIKNSVGVKTRIIILDQKGNRI
jgi:hypothetical protein